MEYYPSFTIDEPDLILKAFDEDGVVVIRDVLTQEECNRTIDDISGEIQKIEPRFDIHDTETYKYATMFNNFGMYSRDPIFTKHTLMNRQNPKIHKAFSILYGTPDLLVNHDRVAFYRPTIDVKMKDGPEDHLEWKTFFDYPGLHLDFNPHHHFDNEDLVNEKMSKIDYTRKKDYTTDNNLTTESMGLLTQAVLNLKDNRHDDGGFQCVPGFHKQIKDWYRGFAPNKNTGYVSHVFNKNVKNDMKYVNSPIRIPMKAGSIVIWNQKIAHGTVPNNSSNGRIVQFMRVYPKKILSKLVRKKRKKGLRLILEGFNHINNTGRIVFDQ
jgi:ectoine hydroxylase-related dioxygenase (phytanoyl-CoA dioxygenase family)